MFGLFQRRHFSSASSTLHDGNINNPGSLRQKPLVAIEDCFVDLSYATDMSWLGRLGSEQVSAAARLRPLWAILILRCPCEIQLISDKAPFWVGYSGDTFS